MGLQKAYCRYCSSEANDRFSIFEAVSEANVCYCPYCATKLVPSQAIKDFHKMMDSLVKKASKVLYQKTDFAEAYRMFGHILEINSDCVEARYGRLLALLYLSTLRKAYFKEFDALFKDDKENHFSKTRDKNGYISFLGKVNFAIDEYDRLFRKRIIVHRYFYNVDCIKLYLVRLREIKNIKLFIINEIEELKAQNKYHADMEELYNDLKRDLVIKDNELSAHLVSGDGSSYRLVEFTDKGNPLVAKENKKTKISSLYSFKKKLDDDGTKGKLIKDRVFPDNTHFYHWIKAAFSFIFVCLTGAFIGTGVGLYMHKKAYSLYWLPFVVVGLLGAVTLVLIVLQIIWRHKIKVRRHLIE